MTKPKYFRVAILIAAALAASGCSVFKQGKGPKTPVLGERIAVLTSESDVAGRSGDGGAADDASRRRSRTRDWAQSGGNATKSMGQLALGDRAARRRSRVQAGRGSSLTARLASAPIVANGRVYTIDTLGAVRAFDARTGALYWASQTPDRQGQRGARSTAAESPTTTAASTRPTASATSSALERAATAASSGRCVPAGRCAARRPSPTARST